MSNFVSCELMKPAFLQVCASCLIYWYKKLRGRIEAFLIVEVLQGLCADCLLSSEMCPLCHLHTISVASIVQLHNFIAFVGNSSF